ncbi:MAG: CoA-binding protein [Candidatus Micrarchaeota archaeon]|nr:CoA-binding protein [Candidatus Micrarchaeota archaeon]
MKCSDNIKYLFSHNSVAVIGATPIPNKVSNVIMRNLIDGKYTGKVYPVNPKYEEVLGLKCYKSVLEIKDNVECAIVATPAEFVPKIVEQCGKKKIKGVIVISGGFGEVGNEELEEELKKVAEKYGIALLGPNCLGAFDPYTKIDSIFLPMYKLERPPPGEIAFVTQSGAVGSTIIDMAAHYKVGISKFISYGNAASLNECDYLKFLENDKETKTIILYVEGAKEGRRLFEIMKKVNKKKPIIALKAGKYGKAILAAKSHTGNLAGSYTAYKAAFRQAKVVEAETLEELFDFVRVFNQPLPNGNGVGIVTNGGGMGVLTSDALEINGLVVADFEKSTVEGLAKILPSYGSVNNPLDLIADASAEGYERALNLFITDKNIDILCVILLTQTPPIDERIIGVLTKIKASTSKPMIVIAVGGSYTDKYRRVLEGYGVPTYGYPDSAVKALKKLVEYAEFRRKM